MIEWVIYLSRIPASHHYCCVEENGMVSNLEDGGNHFFMLCNSPFWFSKTVGAFLTLRSKPFQRKASHLECILPPSYMQSHRVKWCSYFWSLSLASVPCRTGAMVENKMKLIHVLESGFMPGRWSMSIGRGMCICILLKQQYMFRCWWKTSSEPLLDSTWPSVQN